MNVSIGSRLGTYEVVESLGVGGPGAARRHLGELRRGLAEALAASTS